MKLSCLPVSLFTQIIEGQISIGEYAEFAAGIGLDAIDLNVICLKNHTEKYLKSVRKSIEDTGIGLTMLTTYSDFTHPDEEQREREFAHCVSDIATAAQLGAKYLRITAGQGHKPGNTDEQLKAAAVYFARCLEWAEKFRVELLYENHSKPGAWDEPDILYDPDLFLKFAKMLADAGINIDINYDTANSWAYGADPVLILEKVYDKVKTIHVSDMKERYTLQFSEIGKETVPIKEIVSCAKEKGFDGWLCIEEVSGQGFEGIKRAVSWVRKEL